MLVQRTATRTAAAAGSAAARPGRAGAGRITASGLTATRALLPGCAHTGLISTSGRGEARPAEVVGWDELPLVIGGRALVVADRRFFALAQDSGEPAAAHLLWRLLPAGRALPAGPRHAGLVRLLTDIQRLEILAGHRILVLLSQVLLLHENVDVRRRDVAILASIMLNRARVLRAAKHQFRFFFTLRLLAPDRQERGHHDRHHRQCHQHRGHRVPALAFLTL